MKNKIFTFTFLAFLSCSAFAIDTVYKENISNPPFWNECTYSGDVVRDTQLPHGDGEIACKNGYSFKGKFNRGRNGYNYFEKRNKAEIKPIKKAVDYDNGSYIGYFYDGNKHGKGTYSWNSGNKYVGDWVNGKRTGQGKFYWKSGDRYEGAFIDGRRTGFGKYYWADGGRYEGKWVNGKREGLGTEFFTNGSKLRGIWKDSKIDTVYEDTRPPSNDTYVASNNNDSYDDRADLRAAERRLERARMKAERAEERRRNTERIQRKMLETAQLYIDYKNQKKGASDFQKRQAERKIEQAKRDAERQQRDYEDAQREFRRAEQLASARAAKRNENPRSSDANRCVHWDNNAVRNSCNKDIWVKWYSVGVGSSGPGSHCRNGCSLNIVPANGRQTSIGAHKYRKDFAACFLPHRPQEYKKGRSSFYCAKRQDY